MSKDGLIAIIVVIVVVVVFGRKSNIWSFHVYTLSDVSAVASSGPPLPSQKA